MLWLVMILWITLAVASVVVAALYERQVTLATLMACLLFAPITFVVLVVCLGDEVVLWKSKEKET